MHAFQANVDGVLKGVTRRCSALLQANALFAILTLWLTTSRVAELPALPALLMQFNRWTFILALVSGILLITNLPLVWPRNAEEACGKPDAALEFHMGVYTGRAWRYSIALVLVLVLAFAFAFAFAAYALTLLSLTQLN